MNGNFHLAAEAVPQLHRQLRRETALFLIVCGLLAAFLAYGTVHSLDHFLAAAQPPAAASTTNS